MNNQKYFWQGEPVKTDFGVAYPIENTEKPLFWYNYECNWDITHDKPSYDTVKSAVIPAIKITTQSGYSFVIANHNGIGANKLIKGGWPTSTHFSFADDVKFEGCEELGTLRNIFSIREFDEDGFIEYENKRKRWQKENYPVEFEQSERIRNAFKSGRSYSQRKEKA